MGGDFYTYYMLRVIYQDRNRLEEDCRIEDTIKHHYYPEWSDEENEESDRQCANRIVALEREYLDSKLKKYKKSVVFQEGVWICSSQEISMYMKILKENDVWWDKVVFIEKYGDYHCR